jgi:membrane-bound serine protease (ClpP class)
MSDPGEATLEGRSRVAQARFGVEEIGPSLIHFLQMEMRFVRAVFLLLGAVVAVLALAPSAFAATPRVLAIELENDINPVTADYVIGQLERAEEERYDAVVIVLDTPGGLADAMRDIYKRELASQIPVIVYVSPAGARAASAGVWIGQAADILAMAPQTNLGSSTPVSSGGGEIPSDLRRKVINDAAASLRELAEEHDRNGDWAERAVRIGANIGAREALREDVIDVIAPTLPALLDEIDGRRTVPKGFVLNTADARIDTVEMSLWKQILDLVIDPNIIALMLSVGLIGIVVELWNPGLVFPGTVGGISLIVSLYGLQVLPVSAAGILLMLLAVGFWGAELFVPSHGALTVAGAVAFVFGALMLFDPAGPAYQVSLEVALAVAVTLAAFMGLAVTKIVQVRRKPVEVGAHTLVGSTGVVRGDGFVFANGELWRARVPEAVRSGERVVVESVDDHLVMDVRPADEPQPVP